MPFESPESLLNPTPAVEVFGIEVESELTQS